jgi:ubiquinone/menaquinone biosynthesis C-methylase UbiE
MRVYCTLKEAFLMTSPEEPSSRKGHVCPWWLAYTFDNPVRKLFHRPQKLLAPYLAAGMRAMDVGCGMGYFSIAIAKMVGNRGKVFCVDLQRKMLEITEKRARRAKIDGRMVFCRCEPDYLGITEKVDFILNFWMVHEVNDQKAFFSQLQSNLNSTGKILVVEPKIHVAAADFQHTLKIARSAGLQISEQPVIRFSHAALFSNKERKEQRQ